jgi:two-component system sensor histidine kinase DesK
VETMTTPPPAPALDGALRVGERGLARGVSATWWYTVLGIVMFAVIAVLQWVLWIFVHFDGDLRWRFILTAGAGILALIGTGVLVWRYRPNVIAGRDGESPLLQSGDLIGLGTMAVSGALMGVATGSWLAAASILAYALSLRAWPHGIRWRVVLGVTAVLAALGFAESQLWPWGPAPAVVVPAVFAVLLPLVSASSLWWWDIVLELDRAREAESLLAATRERLRLANDVHDLQGHHLQVIALQLELAERLMQRDPEAAAREIARAREAVDAARQGTRDLAAQFRGVPLPDELENAADLLRSAGLEVEARVDADVTDAPADALGPIVRESVTNVLKHGGGHWARLSLERADDAWVYRIANDDAAHDDAGWGSGLDGMTERAQARGGDVQVRRESETFELSVSLPASDRGAA